MLLRQDMHQDRDPHSRGHTHAAASGQVGAANIRRLVATLVLAGAYMVAEAVAGLVSNSLALLADAGHMLSDVAALGLSVFALWIARRPAAPRRSYGYYRAEILAALINGATLVAIAVYIFIEAIGRLRQPPEVRGAVVTWVAAGGLLVNLIGLWILHAGKNESLNVRGAWLHVLTDALGSVGAIAAGVLLTVFGWLWADPAVSIVICLLVLYSSWRLLAESVGVLMEFAPRGMEVDRLRDVMLDVAGVEAVHDLHVWTITSGMNALSAHVVLGPGHRWPQVLTELRRRLREQFGIEHVTLQPEPPGFEEAAMPV